MSQQSGCLSCCHALAFMLTGSRASRAFAGSRPLRCCVDRDFVATRYQPRPVPAISHLSPVVALAQRQHRCGSTLVAPSRSCCFELPVLSQHPTVLRLLLPMQCAPQRSSDSSQQSRQMLCDMSSPGAKQPVVSTTSRRACGNVRSSHIAAHIFARSMSAP